MKKYSIIIASIFALAALLRVVCFVGMIGSDDLNYNRYAYAIANGAFTPQPDHQATRIGLLLPVAGLFTLFGVSEFSSLLFPVCCAMLAYGVLVWAAKTYFGERTAVIAGILYAFLPIDMFHATELLPDLPSSAFIAASLVLCYQIDLRTQTRRLSAIFAFGGMFIAGMLLGWAYLIKETSIFAGVALGGYFCYTLWTRKSAHSSWLGFGLGLLVILGIEAAYYFQITGQPFYRYVSVNAAHNASIYSGSQFHGTGLLRRLFVDQFRTIFRAFDFSFYYVFMLAGSLYGLYKRPKHLRYFIGWFLGVFLLLNFGSTSLSGYFPLVLFPRFFLMLSVPGVVIFAWYVQEIAAIFVKSDRRDLLAMRLSLLVPGIVVVLLNIFVEFSMRNTLFLLFIAIIIAGTFSERWRGWYGNRFAPSTAQFIVIFLVILINLLPGIYLAATGINPEKGLTCEREIRALFGFPLTQTIYTDMRTEQILEYFYRYQSDQQIHRFEETDVNILKRTYLIANWERLFFLNRLYQTPIPDLLYHPPSHWKPVAQIGGYRNPCIIYEIP